jgi:hypothetical protein
MRQALILAVIEVLLKKNLKGCGRDDDFPAGRCDTFQESADFIYAGGCPSYRPEVKVKAGIILANAINNTSPSDEFSYKFVLTTQGIVLS